MNEQAHNTNQQQSPSSAASCESPASVEEQIAQAAKIQDLQAKIIDVLRTCYDPEVPINIYEMGLIYGVDVRGDGSVEIRMTLTSPMCPVAGSLPGEVENKVRAIQGVAAVKVELVWDPVWTPDRMSEAARLQLGIF
ncbi:MAG: SUF system Fe-S cluster assembly protein [Gemmatales bacterium]|nr:MAG: SUF system Fe-S cluster assembly protein [Gemmatales bacterium]